MSERKKLLIWVIVCSILGIAFGYFFNTKGIQIVAGIWLGLGLFFPINVKGKSF